MIRFNFNINNWSWLFFEKLCGFFVAFCFIAISQSCAENLSVAQSCWNQD